MQLDREDEEDVEDVKNFPKPWEKMPMAGVFDAVESSKAVKFAVNASWLVNWFLLFVKLYLFIVSQSKAALAALADSAVDLVSQAILSLADRYISRHSPDYPVGRSRLEALSVIGCAAIMIFASIEVIQYSIIDLYHGIINHNLELEISLYVYLLFASGIILKLLLYIYCAQVYRVMKSDMVQALAEDHINDVASNSAAISTLSDSDT